MSQRLTVCLTAINSLLVGLLLGGRLPLEPARSLAATPEASGSEESPVLRGRARI